MESHYLGDQNDEDIEPMHSALYDGDGGFQYLYKDPMLTAIYEEARFWFSTLAFRRLKRSKFFVFFNVENEFWFFFFGFRLPDWTDLTCDEKPINKICSSRYINEINNSYTQIKKIGSIIKGN